MPLQLFDAVSCNLVHNKDVDAFQHHRIVGFHVAYVRIDRGQPFVVVVDPNLVGRKLPLNFIEPRFQAVDDCGPFLISILRSRCL